MTDLHIITKQAINITKKHEEHEPEVGRFPRSQHRDHRTLGKVDRMSPGEGADHEHAADDDAPVASERRFDGTRGFSHSR